MKFNYRDDFLIKRDCIEKPWLNIYIYIYIYISFEIFYNRHLVGVEFEIYKI